MFKMSNELLSNGERTYMFSQTKKMESGDSVDFEAVRISRKKDIDYYGIMLSVYRKKRDRDVMDPVQTGKGSISGLLWAKKCILEFEKFIKDNPFLFKETVVILIEWTDGRRKSVYEWALKKHGYQNEWRLNRKCLAKWVKSR